MRMYPPIHRVIRSMCACTVVCLLSALGAADGHGAPPTARSIYDATGVRGGLIVHVGCDDPAAIASLRANSRYLVHALDTDPSKVNAAREFFYKKGLNGEVSASVFDGRKLPYADGMVNLIQVSGVSFQVSAPEVGRVLAPRGIAMVHGSWFMVDGKKKELPGLNALTIKHQPSTIGRNWFAYRKPVPPEIDEWSHFLHDAGGDATARDSQVASPKRLRWIAPPKWCRSHEMPSSVGAVVTAGGRIFSFIDESVIGVYEKVPWKCVLVARNAWNGVLLWKKPLRDWQPEHGTGTGGRWLIHHTIPRRLVADGDHVYATLQFVGSPVSILDAATGAVVVEALEGTTGADEILVSDGVLVAKTTEGLSPGATQRITAGKTTDGLVAVDTKTHKMLWRKENVCVLPYALAAQSGKVVYHNMNELVCLDARTGADAWRAPCKVGSASGAGSTLLIHDGIVLYNGSVQPPATPKPEQPAAPKAPAKSGKKKKRRKPKGGRGRRLLTAFSLADGKQLWQKPGATSLAQACNQPGDVFVAKGVVWCGASTQGLDLKTGEPKGQVALHKLISPGHHARCHRAKATERFVIRPKRGAEFVDLENGDHMRNDWLRAPCFTGLTPANGLLYVPTDQCFCYPGVKVPGYMALSGDKPEPLKPSGPDALEKGPAYGQIQGGIPSPRDWPAYRCDSQRSGRAGMAVQANLKKAWEAKLGSGSHQAVVVGDRLWVVEKNRHTVRCLKADTGDKLWRFTAGGRVDSPPTFHNGALLFGSRDGSVYCVRASDGKLVWRFRAAPKEHKIVSYDQLESIWPVHGSILVQDGVAYFAAGRSSFLDGGMLVYGIDAAKGTPLHHHVLEGPWPDIKEDTGSPFAMEGALPDIFVSDGKDLYMLRIKFDAQLKRLPTEKESSLGELNMGKIHLVATGGFLDDSGFDRLFWMYSKRWPGFYFAQHSPKAGQLVVFDDSTTYAVKYFYLRNRWSPQFIPAGEGYILFADDNDNEPTFHEKGKTVVPWLPADTGNGRRGGRGVEKGTGYVREKPPKWKTMVPLRVRSMVIADGLLFAAGTPDKIDPEDPLAAFEGRAGAELRVFSASDGKEIKKYDLPGIPAFDGMSAAGGKLYIATLDGRLLCYGP